MRPAPTRSDIAPVLRWCEIQYDRMDWSGALRGRVRQQLESLFLEVSDSWPGDGTTCETPDPMVTGSDRKAGISVHIGADRLCCLIASDRGNSNTFENIWPGWLEKAVDALPSASLRRMAVGLVLTGPKHTDTWGWPRIGLVSGWALKSHLTTATAQTDVGEMEIRSGWPNEQVLSGDLEIWARENVNLEECKESDIVFHLCHYKSTVDKKDDIFLQNNVFDSLRQLDRQLFECARQIIRFPDSGGTCAVPPQVEEAIVEYRAEAKAATVSAGGKARLIEHLGLICDVFGLTRAQLADALHVSRQALHGWKHGATPRETQLKRIYSLRRAALNWKQSGFDTPSAPQLHEPVVQKQGLLELLAADKFDFEAIQFIGRHFRFHKETSRKTSFIDPFSIDEHSKR